MENYEAQFIALCLDCDEYTKEGVRRHNRAVKKLSALYRNLEEDKSFAEELYGRLLLHSDERVRSTAAAHCLGMNIHLSEAKATLRDIAANSPAPFARFNAETTLQIWESQGFLYF